MRATMRAAGALVVLLAMTALVGPFGADRSSRRLVADGAATAARVVSPTPGVANVVGSPTKSLDGDPVTIDLGHAVIYGDSLADQADIYLRSILEDRYDTDVDIRAVGGIAPCDLLDQIARDAENEPPTVAVLAFSGNALTPCTTGASTPTEIGSRYRKDINTAVRLLERSGATVVIIGHPPMKGERSASALNAVFTNIARADSRVGFVSADPFLSNEGAFARDLRCLDGEPCCGSSTGRSGYNRVRGDDDIHFHDPRWNMPDAADDVCEVWSSGAYRYALTIAEALDPDAEVRPR